MHEDGDEIKYFGQGRQAEVGWEWHEWRLEVERRVILAERKVSILLAERRAGRLAVTADEPDDDTPTSYPHDAHEPTETPLVEVVPSPVAGAVTVDLTPVTGGVFGVAPAPTPDEIAQASTNDPAVVAAVAKIIATGNAAAATVAMSTPTKSARKRAVRCPPTEARVRVQQALTSAQSTIRGITAWETATGWGIPLTSSQIRPALKELEKRGDVHVVGKRGKQEIWAIKS